MNIMDYSNFKDVPENARKDDSKGDLKDDLWRLAADLRSHPSIRSKPPIGQATNMLGLQQNSIGCPGDDAAFLQRADGGYDLLAGEGFIPSFVNDDPWFAGWCGIMVNVSDIAAMGGRAAGVIDQIWSPDAELAKPLLAGMRAAADAYNVPILGGHTNFSAEKLNMSVSIFGRADALITSFNAKPGDILIAAIDHRGAYRNFDNFFAAEQAPHERLRADLEILPQLAEDGLVHAGKDISQGGIIGTALMLAECSHVGIEIDIERLAPAGAIDVERWLRTFPSFGFLLSVPSENVATVCNRFSQRDINPQIIGMVNSHTTVCLRAGENVQQFWDYKEQQYLGFTNNGDV